jgi:alpha-glucosidase
VISLPQVDVTAPRIAGVVPDAGQFGQPDAGGLADQAYDVHAILVPAPDHELTTSALQALLFAAGPDGPWHDGWVNLETATQARQTK